MKTLYLLLLYLLLLIGPARAQGLPMASPAAVELSAPHLDSLSTALQRYVDEGKVAGLVAMIARRGQVAYHEAFGLLSRETGQPMPPDALFRIHSMTKPITSVAVLMLYEEGALALDDPVAKYVPAFARVEVYAGSEKSDGTTAVQRPIIVQDLLLHTAGLTSGSFGNTAVDALYREKNPVGTARSLAALADALAGLPLLHQPGAAWTYSLATDVLARIVEVASGEAFDAFLQRRIFAPLQMHDTGFYVPAGKLDRLTSFYESTPEGLRLLDAPPASAYAHPPAFPRGNTGLLSTAADYVRFAQMLLNEGTLDGVRLLHPETVRLMTRNHLPPALIPLRVGPFTFSGQGFGLGVGVQVDAAAQPGSEGLFWWVGSAHTYFWVDPQRDLIGILMTQLQPVGRYPILPAFHARVYDAVLD